jgi:hypothetical protein
LSSINRPVVDGKIAHPVTGEIQKAGRMGLTDGPPGVSFHLLNMNLDVNFRSVHKVFRVPVEDLYTAVARHVRNGVYKLVSINASEYSFVVVCKIQVSAEEFDIAWKNIFSKGSDFKYTDEEWDIAWEKRWGKE